MSSLIYKGHPSPRVTWLKNGIEIEKLESNRIEISTDSTNCSTSLCIKSVTKEDEGKYSISARNSLGRQIHNVEILVDCPEATGTGSAGKSGSTSFASNLLTLNGPTETQSQLPTTPAMPSLAYTKQNEKKTEPKKEDPVAPPPVTTVDAGHVSSEDEPTVPPPVDRLRSKTVTPEKTVAASETAEAQGPKLVKGLESTSGRHEREDYIVLEVEFENAKSVEWRLNGSNDIGGVIRETINGSKLRIRSFEEKDVGEYEAIGIGANGATTRTSCTLSLLQSSRPGSKHSSPEQTVLSPVSPRSTEIDGKTRETRSKEYF